MLHFNAKAISVMFCQIHAQLSVFLTIWLFQPHRGKRLLSCFSHESCSGEWLSFACCLSLAQGLLKLEGFLSRARQEGLGTAAGGAVAYSSEANTALLDWL